MQKAVPLRSRRGRHLRLVPGAVTSLTLLCGFFSLLATMHEQWVAAVWAVWMGALCDMIDGMCARQLGEESEAGAAYDSLADVVTFSLAPACLFYEWYAWRLGIVGAGVAYLFALAGAVRLARFMAQRSTVMPGWFEGLPTTVAGSLLCVLLLSGQGADRVAVAGFFCCASLVLSVLKVSTIAYPKAATVWRWLRRMVGVRWGSGLVAIVAFGVLFDRRVPATLLVGYVVGMIGVSVAVRWSKK